MAENTGMDVAAELWRRPSGALPARSTSPRATTERRSFFATGEWPRCRVPAKTRPALGMRLVSGGCPASIWGRPEHRASAPAHATGRRSGANGPGRAPRGRGGGLGADVTTSRPSWHGPIRPPPSPRSLLTRRLRRDRACRNCSRRPGNAESVGGRSCARDRRSRHSSAPGRRCVGGTDAALRPTDWAVACRVDGWRTLRAIAEQSGFTLMEAASILRGLMAAGFATVPGMHLPTTTRGLRCNESRDDRDPPVLAPGSDTFATATAAGAATASDCPGTMAGQAFDDRPTCCGSCPSSATQSTPAATQVALTTGR